MVSARIPYGPLLATAVLVLHAGAAAQHPTETASSSHLPHYAAPELCPDAASWVDAVLSRLAPEARAYARRELPVLVEGIEVAADGKRAALRLRGATSERVVMGRDCGEVLAGAALIAAIAFGSAHDPGEEKPAPPTPNALHAMQDPASNGPSAAPEPAVTAEVTLESDTQPVDTGVVDREPETQTATTTTARWALGAGAATHTGFAPWPAGLLDGGIELSLPEQRWSIRARGLLGVSRASVQQRSAHFLLIGGGVDVCPLVFGAHLGWQWRNCAAIDLGRVYAEGEAESALRAAERQQIWWSALGIVTRLQTPRAYGFRLELEAGASAPLWHRKLEFRDPNSTLFETPALALSGRLGLQVPLE